MVDRGSTYAWLARRLGISKSYLSDIMAGRAATPPWFYERTAAVLNVSADELRDAPESAQEAA